jgi:myosin heavy chain 9/10/11/14
MDIQYVWKKVDKSKYTLTNKQDLENHDEFELYNKNDNFKLYNLSSLKIINIPSIMNVLKQRYEKDIIYTFNGNVLISINPFKKINNLYCFDKILNTQKPHIFSTAELAYKNINKSNQAILVSGESGSGKTENTKYILKYLSNNYGIDENISKNIILCNHLVECFGNAMTIKNDNSSRFGKFIKIFMNNDNKIIGANIENYLLEKSRITSYNNKEKSYHIFYFYKSPLLSKYQFSESYSLIENTSDKIIDEFSDPTLLIETFKLFDFSTNDIDTVFYTIKLILELSNVTCYSTLNTILDKNLNTLYSLNLKKDILQTLFTKKTIKIGDELITKELTYNETEITIKSYMEDIYSQLFNTIIEKINIKLGNTSNKHIAILDIFGFEIFEKNGYEQLCINYTNEILQNIYNKNILEDEQIEYEKEGITWKYINYQSNKAIVNLFDSNLSIFGIINEQSILSSGNDNNIYNSIHKNLSSHSNLSITNKNIRSKIFSIEHYAGNVNYTVNNYIIKNRIKSKNRKIKTNLQMFTNQLKLLQKELDKCTCLFVRCIKPNDKNISDLFNYEKIHDQLLYSGVIEGIKLILKGYPVKLKINELPNEFKFLYTSTSDIVSLLDNEDKDKYSFGKSKLFMKRDIYDYLSNINNVIKDKLAIKITKNIRMWFYRKQYMHKLSCILKIQTLFRKFIKRKAYILIIKNLRATRIQSIARKYIVRKKYLLIRTKIVKIQKSIRSYKLRGVIYNLIGIRNIKKYSCKIIVRFLKGCVLKRKKDIQYQNLKLKEKIAKKDNENQNKLDVIVNQIDTIKEELNNKDKELDNIKQELSDKDKEIEELRKLLTKKNKTNIVNKIDNSYMERDDIMYEVNLNEERDTETILIVGKKLENLYLELNSKEELMKKLESDNRLLAKLYKNEFGKKNLTVWQKIFGK